MQKPLSLDEIGRDKKRLTEQKESLERQIKALVSVQTALWIENPDPLHRNSSQYTFGPHRQVMADAIYEVLKEDRPLNRRVILSRVIERGVLVKEVHPLHRVSEILTADEHFEKVPNKHGYWTLSESCPNDLTDPVELNQEIHTQNETGEGCSPSPASTKREVLSLMATKELIIPSQANNGKNSQAPALVTALGPSDPDDGDPGRQQRGIAIAAISSIKKTKVGYKVRSQSGKSDYTVRLDGEDGPACECPDFEMRDEPCKHIYAVEGYVMREDNPAESPDWTAKEKAALETGTVAKRPTYSQNWPAYNAAQVNEQEMFVELLRKACDTIPLPPPGMGRPRFPLSDRVFSLATKVYSTKSTRRAMTDLRNATKEGLLEKTPDFSSITRWMESPEMTPLLVALIEQSALPFATLEEVEEVDFAADSSGFTIVPYERWFDHKWGRPAKRGQYAKAHVTCGVKSKIITAAVVTPGESSDSRQLPAMVNTTARNFTIREVAGDKGYLGRGNFEAVDNVGGVGYFPFKKDSVARNSHHKQDTQADLWEKMFHFYHLHREEWLAYYHKRSNVEACFWMVKSKFGGSVRGKTPTARVNEVYVKLLCHNLVVLVKAMCEFGIDPSWQEGREVLPMAA